LRSSRSEETKARILLLFRKCSHHFGSTAVSNNLIKIVNTRELVSRVCTLCAVDICPNVLCWQGGTSPFTADTARHATELEQNWRGLGSSCHNVQLGTRRWSRSQVFSSGAVGCEPIWSPCLIFLTSSTWPADMRLWWRPRSQKLSIAALPSIVEIWIEMESSINRYPTAEQLTRTRCECGKIETMLEWPH